MGRVNRTQKEKEQYLIRKYCNLLHYKISQPKWPNPPDALLTLRKGRFKERVAIEHTSYHSDTVAGTCSPLTPMSEFWENVQASLSRRIRYRKNLADIATGRVQLKANLKVQGNDIALARQFAEEFVEFLKDRPFSEKERIPPYLTPPPVATFSGFRTLESMVSYMWIYRIKGGNFSRCIWICENISTGCIGLDLNYIKSAIKVKNEKAVKYDWQSAEEKWLLIVAEGGILSNNAGPAEQKVNWNDPILDELCRVSPFNKIVFWEYARNWCKLIKPNKPIVKYDK